MTVPRISLHTRVAFADESRHNVGRFRSLALITAARDHVDSLTSEVAGLLASSSVKEMKWSRLRSARERFAAEKLLTWAVEAAVARRLSIDALVWDTRDSRHHVLGRDDVANLHRMYYRLLSSALRRPAFRGDVWILRPDDNSVMDWESVHDVLHNSGLGSQSQTDLLSGVRLWRRATRQHLIEAIEPADSAATPLVQLADLVAGLTAYSYDRYAAYETWCRDEEVKLQLALFPSDAGSSVKLSVADRHRCPVLRTLDTRCKDAKLGVSLTTNRGLTTYPPGHGVNFWLYRPQRLTDRAPIRSAALLPDA
jgi:hypothetical protein